VDLARAARVAEELDPAGAVDEVEEDELAVAAPRHDAAGDPPRFPRLLPRLEPRGLVANIGHERPVLKTLRQRPSSRLCGSHVAFRKQHSPDSSRGLSKFLFD